MADRVRILRVGEGESPSAWGEALGGRSWEAGDRIKHDGPRSVWHATVLGSAVSVKVRPASGLRVRLRLTEFGRSVRAAKRLARNGVETAPVFAHAVVGGDEVLVNAWLEGPTLLAVLAEASEDEKPPLVRAAGSLIGRQLKAVLFNRDHKPSNIIVVDRASAALALVDVGGVRRIAFATSTTWIRLATRMCAAVCTEPMGVGHPLGEEHRRVLVETVALGTASGWSGITATELRDKLWTELDRTIAAHGDAVPKINPLGPRDP
ncbi:MAG: hypothetical protein AAGF47_07880 [Planctomycetota bacterium]